MGWLVSVSLCRKVEETRDVAPEVAAGVDMIPLIWEGVRASSCVVDALATCCWTGPVSRFPLRCEGVALRGGLQLYSRLTQSFCQPGVSIIAG
jgi:hypothetical protein